MLEAWQHFSPRSNPGRRAHLLLRFLMISLEFPFAHSTPERSLSSLLESLNRQPASGKVRAVKPSLPHVLHGRPQWVAPAWLISVLLAACFGPPPPPVLTVLPSYGLTDSRGEPFGTEQLTGQVYVANFFFTRCTSVCPMLTNSMSRLQHRYRESGIGGVRLVSISVDGAHDTPDQLRAYAERHSIETESWSLLTGPRERVHPLVLEGFLLPLGDPQEDEQGVMDIAHAGRLVLVDRWGQVRGYYDGSTSGLDDLFERSQRVLEEKHRPPPRAS